MTLLFPMFPDHFNIGQRKNPSRLFCARPPLSPRQALDLADLGKQGALVHFQQPGQFRE
jgi:hypothetical protein